MNKSKQIKTVPFLFAIYKILIFIDLSSSFALHRSTICHFVKNALSGTMADGSVNEFTRNRNV